MEASQHGNRDQIPPDIQCKHRLYNSDLIRLNMIVISQDKLAKYSRKGKSEAYSWFSQG